MHLLAKYGVAFSFEAPIPKVNDTDFAASADWTPATGDVKVSKDGGAVANIATLPTAVTGTGSVLWTWALSATEMQAARITIQVVDAAVENQVFIVQTYGNASAQHAADFDDTVRLGLTALPAAVANANGGLMLRSTAAGTPASEIAETTQNTFFLGASGETAASAVAGSAVYETAVKALAQVIENSLDVSEVLRLLLAVSCGKLSGASTTTISIRDTADGKDRVVATVDSSGNRSAVTLDAS